MPLQPILIVNMFDVWGIDFMGPLPTSSRHEYKLVAVISLQMGRGHTY